MQAANQDMAELERVVPMPEHSANGNRAATQWPTELRTLFDVLHTVALGFGDSASDAAARSATAVVAIAQNMGGRGVYLPRGESLMVAVRDRQMYAQFSGGGGDEVKRLATQHDLTDIHVYRILAREHKASVARRQGDLFSTKRKGRD